MKYNLLLESFHEWFDNLQFNYTEISSSKFLLEAQKCETADAKERLKQKAATEKLKRKRNDEDNSSYLNRQQKDKNQSDKKQKSKQKTSKGGEARLCDLYKAAVTFHKSV